MVRGRIINNVSEGIITPRTIDYGAVIYMFIHNLISYAKGLPWTLSQKPEALNLEPFIRSLETEVLSQEPLTFSLETYAIQHSTEAFSLSPNLVRVKGKLQIVRIYITSSTSCPSHYQGYSSLLALVDWGLGEDAFWGYTGAFTLKDFHLVG